MPLGRSASRQGPRNSKSSSTMHKAADLALDALEPGDDASLGRFMHVCASLDTLPLWGI